MRSSTYLILISCLVPCLGQDLTTTLCPQGGMLNDFNQDDQSATKCFFYVKGHDWTANAHGEGDKICQEYGGASAKLAHPNGPIENEIIRMVLEKDNAKEILLGIRIVSIEDGYVITFKGIHNDHLHSYDKNQDYTQRYELVVGETGVVTESEYSYFLQPKTEDLARFIGKTGLCVVMNTNKGAWQIDTCSMLPTKSEVACQSEVFKQCKFYDNPDCKYDAKYKSCTQVVTENCPPKVPPIIYCNANCKASCEFSNVAESGCHGTCKKREKTVYKIGLHVYPDSKCEIDNIESKPCTEPCTGCVLTDWSEWNPKKCPNCKSTEEEVYRTRTRTATYSEDPQLSQEDCEEKMELEQKFVCDIPLCDINCVQEFSPWSVCSATCGYYGTQTRTSKPLIAKSGSGLECNDEYISRPCPNVSCPVDCVMSGWDDEPCSASCGNGTIKRTRKVVTQPEFGGKKCPDNFEQTVGCAADPCIVNCTLTDEWDAWEACTASCGGKGKKRRQKKASVEANDWGYCDNPYETVPCEGLPACPANNSTYDYTDAPEGMSGEMQIVIVASTVVALIILVVLFAGAYFYLRRDARKKSTKHSRELMEQAMQDVLGQKVKARSNKGSLSGKATTESRTTSPKVKRGDSGLAASSSSPSRGKVSKIRAKSNAPKGKQSQRKNRNG